VKVDVLKDVVSILDHRLTTGQRMRADLLVKELTQGAEAPLSENLPAMTEKNSPSVSIHGKEFTDTVASWVKKRICGRTVYGAAASRFSLQFYVGHRTAG